MGGALADELVVPERSAWPVPDGVGLEAACCIPIVYGTADLALRHRAELRGGQTLLVLGAAGGVGVAACQIGKAIGARVVAVAGGREKVEFLRRLGCVDVVDSTAFGDPTAKGQELHKAIKAVAPKGGILQPHCLLNSSKS